MCHAEPNRAGTVVHVSVNAVQGQAGSDPMLFKLARVYCTCLNIPFWIVVIVWLPEVFVLLQNAKIHNKQLT